MWLKTIAPVILALTLSSCSTGTGGCFPPTELMVKAAPLDPLDTSKAMSETEALIQWNKDVGAYNGLALDHNALVKWVGDHCVS